MSLATVAQACSAHAPAESPAATFTPTTVTPLPLGPRPTSTEPATTRLILVNRSGQTVCYVFISPVSQPDWGQDWLGPVERVYSGAARAFAVPPGEWDLRAEDCYGVLIAQAFQRSISAPAWEWVLPPRPLPPSGEVTLRIVNALTVDVCAVRVSLSSDPYWGDDWLGAAVILPGGSHELAIPPGGVYDLRAEDCRGEVLQEQLNTAISNDVTVWTLAEQ